MHLLTHTLLRLFALCCLTTAAASAAPVNASASRSAEMPELTLFQGETRVITEPNVGRLAVGNGKALSAAVLDEREILLIANEIGT